MEKVVTFKLFSVNSHPDLVEFLYVDALGNKILYAILLLYSAVSVDKIVLIKHLFD